MSVFDTDALARLADIHEVSTLLAECNRSVDRAEESSSVPDLHRYSASARAFVGALAAERIPWATGNHRSSRAWISIRGGAAVAESYVIASTETSDTDSRTQHLIGGRFLDHLAVVNGAWRLVNRHFVLDWNRSSAGAAKPSPSSSTTLEHAVPRGGRGAADAGRALLTLAAARMDKGNASGAGNAVGADVLEELLSRQAIHDLLMAYARGMDRADTELLESVFWPDASVVSGVINGSGPRFAREITGYLRSNLVRCFHSIANEWVVVKGDRAMGEAYVIATMTASGDDTIGGGRYIDEFERRDGVWKIRSHVFVADWSMTQPTSNKDDGIYEPMRPCGCFGTADPVYALWATAD